MTAKFQLGDRIIVSANYHWAKSATGKTRLGNSVTRDGKIVMPYRRFGMTPFAELETNAPAALTRQTGAP